MIILLTGPMASGKSTVAKLLAQSLDRSVHLRGDIFRRMIVRSREEMTAEPSAEALLQLRLRYRLSAEAAKGYQEAGFAVVLQDNYYGEMLSEMLAMLEPTPVQVVVLCPSVEVIEQRERARGKVGYHGFDIAALHRAFMEETPRIGLWIDNGEQTPEETAAQILQMLDLSGIRDRSTKVPYTEDSAMQPNASISVEHDALPLVDVAACGIGTGHRRVELCLTSGR